jgi:hypothetical protein
MRCARHAAGTWKKQSCNYGERGMTFLLPMYVDGGSTGQRNAQRLQIQACGGPVGTGRQSQSPSAVGEQEPQRRCDERTSPVRQGRFETSNRPERFPVSDRDTHVQSPVYDCPDHWGVQVCKSLQRPQPERWVRPLALTNEHSTYCKSALASDILRG